jgi:hypothetical protein
MPYLGMAAHGILLRSDDSVFIHLHPMGTAPLAASQAFAAKDRGDTNSAGRLIARPADAMPAMTLSNEFVLPYEFPKPGRYRLWVQVKPGRDVLTGVFDIEVR